MSEYSPEQFESAFWAAVKDDNWQAAEALMEMYAVAYPYRCAAFRRRLGVAVASARATHE